MSDTRPRLDTGAVLKLSVLFAAAFCLEGAAAYAAWGEPLSPRWWNWAAALGLHTACSLAFVLCPCNRDKAAVYFSRLAGLLTFFLPLFGLFGAFTAFVSARGLLTSHGLADDLKSADADPGEAVDTEIRDLHAFLQDELSTEPIVDILKGDDVDLKRGAVNFLRRMGTADAIKLLRRCLADPSGEVRFYAHTALTRVEEDYANSIDLAKKKAGDGTAASLAALGRIYRDYADSGLPGEDMRAFYVSEARQKIKEAYAMEPGDTRLALDLGRLALLTGDAAASRKRFEEAAAAPDTLMEAHLGLCDVYLQTRDFKSLVVMARRMAKHGTPPSMDPFKTIVYTFWARAGERAAVP